MGGSSIAPFVVVARPVTPAIGIVAGMGRDTLARRLDGRRGVRFMVPTPDYVGPIVEPHALGFRGVNGRQDGFRELPNPNVQGINLRAWNDPFSLRFGFRRHPIAPHGYTNPARLMPVTPMRARVERSPP